MKKLIIIIPLFITAVILLLLRMVFSNDAREFYYVKIDNSKVESWGPRDGVIDFKGGMEYGYTLTGCNEFGREKSVTFGTNRLLKNGAYLKLSVVPIRGVTEWEEVAFEEMPYEVKEKLK